VDVSGLCCSPRDFFHHDRNRDQKAGPDQSNRDDKFSIGSWFFLFGKILMKNFSADTDEKMATNPETTA
jgi:hypothetical protein